MSIHVGITHRTTYKFDRLIGVSPHVVRLRPAPHCRTPILAYSLTIEPDDHFINWQQDPFGNYLARVVFPERTRTLTFTVDIVADMAVVNPFDFFIDESAQTFPFAYEPGLQRDLGPYFAGADSGLMLDQWMGSVASRLTFPDLTRVPTIDFLVAINQLVQRDIAYSVRMEPGVQTPDETLERSLGSCRDSAWLLVQILRRLGLASRFASGYLVQLVSDKAVLDGPSGPTKDFTDLHAWAEVFVPGAGWIGLDPTSGLFAGEGHIPLACTPEPSTAAAIDGLIDSCVSTLEFSNEVTRVLEEPRVTLPYTDTQWANINQLGQGVDERLAAGDVRLTMGGEPTFVSIDDMEAPEWTIAADGPQKRQRAGEVARRLAAAFASGGVLHHGQGKWYPGEPLPRWQISIFWRTDGVPLWHDSALLADPSSPGDAEVHDASALSSAIAKSLGVPVGFVVPLYEDAVHRLWTEARLPAGEPVMLHLGPDEMSATTVDSRRALMADLDSDIGDPAGFAIPIHRAEGGWATTEWLLRRGFAFLSPGDSPVGLRLPLDSLMWSPPPPLPDESPFAEKPSLPTDVAHGLKESTKESTKDKNRDETEDGANESSGITGVPPALIVARVDSPTTALCVEERDGHLYVFLPPLSDLADSVAMLWAVESAAREIGKPIVLEGYGIGRDPRVQTLVVAPDPGVLEINVHPAGSWNELVHITETVHREAELSRLGTETFQLDGSHSGTGGGNHITLGAAKSEDSPMLRRPDLLRSLLTYWQHHPSLSYVFSGRFIGPTSQSPRVDEGRNENLYELEIAFAQLEALGEDTRPWHVDRLLRHLLTDITGNTHRAEFCIDKLFSPDSERGRLGLLEVRGFEMPPHPQMALVQALLVRSLVAKFWDKPYTGDLIRWGTQLHDRFLLPSFAAADMADVVEDLRADGIAFEMSWLDPFLAFRFPAIGSFVAGPVTIEIRKAVEPWHVLGEEVSSTGTARYVDSSVERVQVCAVGAVEGRHIVTCNGIAVPLRLSGSSNAGGVRYKAWSPPSALHPTIDVQVPLVFDVIDLWSGRSLGGCRYHVAHPGGRNYVTFPINANEAEARRRVRFETTGHTGGKLEDSELERLNAQRLGSPEYPLTLDLRRFANRLLTDHTH